MRIAAVVLMCTLVTACFASSTFARYTSQATGTTEVVKVAKWDITVSDKDDNDVQIALAEGKATFDIATTITGLETGDSGAELTGKDNDVTADNLIAPGTKGAYKFEVTNSSEVTAMIAIDIDDVEWTNAPADVDEPTITPVAPTVKIDNVAATTKTESSVTYYVIPAGKTAVVEAGWKWAYAGNEEIDTAWGIAAQNAEEAPTATITVDVTAIQVD